MNTKQIAILIAGVTLIIILFIANNFEIQNYISTHTFEKGYSGGNFTSYESTKFFNDPEVKKINFRYNSIILIIVIGTGAGIYLNKNKKDY